MKKIYLRKSGLISALIVLFATSTSAQVFFTEDFEGVIDTTTNLPVSWMESGLSDDGVWSVGDAAAASSTYITWPVPSTGTKFAYTNDDACNCDKSADRIILPTQDFTGMVAVRMNLDVYLNGGYGETMVLDASTDGGASWTTVFNFVGAGDTWNNVDINLNAYADSSNVVLSFLYNDASTWAYAGGIDNLTLEELSSSDDLALTATKGEYTLIPLNQATSMTLQAEARNFGVNIVTDAVLKTNIYVNGVLATTKTSGSNSILPGDSLEIISGTYTPADTGINVFEHIISSSSITDANSANDTITYAFNVTLDQYARDNGQASISLGVNGAGNTAIIGSIFDVNNTAQMTFGFALHNFAAIGDTLQLSVYNILNGMPNELIGGSDLYIISSEDSIAGSTLLALEIADTAGNPLILSPGKYLLGSSEFGGTDNFNLAMSDDIFTPNTVFASINNAAWATMESVGFPNTPIIRPNLVEVDPNNIEEVNVVSNINLFPNPAQNSVWIESELIEANATITITSQTGKVVLNKTIANISNRINLNIKDLANGIYMLSINNNNTIETQKLIVLH